VSEAGGDERMSGGSMGKNGSCLSRSFQTNVARSTFKRKLRNALGLTFAPKELSLSLWYWIQNAIPSVKWTFEEGEVRWTS
jgi:hypothetical protein